MSCEQAMRKFPAYQTTSFSYAWLTLACNVRWLHEHLVHVGASLVMVRSWPRVKVWLCQASYLQMAPVLLAFSPTCLVSIHHCNCLLTPHQT